MDEIEAEEMTWIQVARWTMVGNANEHRPPISAPRIAPLETAVNGARTRTRMATATATQLATDNHNHTPREVEVEVEVVLSDR